MYCYDFEFAGKVFRLQHCQEIHVNTSFRPFQISGREPDCTISFFENDKLVFWEKPSVYSNISFEVQREENGFVRQYWEHKNNGYRYATSRIENNGRNEIVEYLPQYQAAFSQMQNSFSHVAFEELLINQERMILHASLVDTTMGGILFSGPSGVGKSTQAELWKQYEAAEIINGDRPIVGKENGVWTAWGSPYAGSSGYHIQKSARMKAIVMLSQGKENCVRRLSIRQAMTKLLVETTMNRWNESFTNRAVDMVMELAATVPVYQLECTPDIRAVEALKKYLK